MASLFGLPFDEPPAPAPAEPPARRVYTVSELTAEIRQVLEGTWFEVWVEGELSNCKVWGQAGHLYLTLKDDRAQIKGFMFRSDVRRLKFKPEDGLRVVARGRLTVYEPKGEYQLTCTSLEPRGLGALQLAFDQLKRKLQAEGLFDQARKRPLPWLPRKIGVVTSIDGAAVRDVIKVLGQRYPNVHVVIRPARVQGEGAAEDLARALEQVAAWEGVEVVILARGGGSIEDLWAFNEERVARAIAASPVPVIAGIGHETDFTIADFVADLRAPTPTAAAEQVSPSREEWMQRLTTLQHRLARPLHRLLAARAQAVDLAARRLVHPAQRLQVQRDTLAHLGRRLGLAHAQSLSRRRWQFDALARRLAAARPQPQRATLEQLQTGLDRALAQQMQNRRAALERMAAHLAHLNPEAVLARGYSVVRNAQGKLISASAQIALDETLELRFHQGGAQARVTRKDD